MTEPAFVLAPIACAAVLLLSGVAKYGEVEATRASFTAMKVPAALGSTAVVKALPVGEIALGVLLLVTWGWVQGVVAVGATALFATYWLLVARVLRSGDEVDCGCFGAVGDDLVTATTLVRNTLLVVLAAVAAAAGFAGSGLVPVVRDLDGSRAWWLVMSALVAALAVLVVGSGRPAADEVETDAELLDYERTPIPFGVLMDGQGTMTSLGRLSGLGPQLLVFLSGTCTPCRELAEEMSQWRDRLGPVQLNAVYASPLDAVPADAKPGEGVAQWYDYEMGATNVLASGGRPAAALLGPDGWMAGGPVFGKPAVLEFVDDIAAELASVESEPAQA